MRIKTKSGCNDITYDDVENLLMDISASGWADFRLEYRRRHGTESNLDRGDEEYIIKSITRMERGEV